MASRRASREETTKLETRALRGVPWTIVGYAGSRGLSLVGTLALARLLLPEEIGVVATAMVIVTVLNLLSDNGLGIALVVEENLDETMAGTILACMLALGTALAVAVTLGAGVLSDLFNVPGLAEIMPALAVTVIFSTVSWFCQGLLQRLLLFRARFLGQLALAVGYVGVAVPAAIAGAGVWSLVVGQVVGTALSALVLWTRLPEPVRPTFDLGAARRAFTRSRAFLSQAFTSFLTGNLHFIAVASLLGPGSMGIFSMSYRLTELPAQGLATPVANATFPAVVRLEGERRIAPLLVSMRYVAFAALPALAGLAALAPPFVAAVLGPRWTSMNAILPLLCAWGALTALTSVLAWFVNATGGAGWIARLNLARLVVVGPALFVAAGPLDSLRAVAIVLLFDAVVDVVLVTTFAHRRLGVRASRLWGAVRGVVLATVGLVVVALLARAGARALGAVPLVELLAAGVAAGAAYLALVRVTEPSLLARGGDLLRGALNRSPDSPPVTPDEAATPPPGP